MSKAQYIMLGGFLGAGKTTAVLKFAEYLDSKNQKVGLITNDQSFGLVDTTMLSSHGFPVEEITGGCFCCRFTSLIDAADKLSEDSRPEVFIAEPVGSCTDLRASVSYPLRRIYGDNFRVAPLSVLVDPIRALRIHGVESGPKFSKKVIYVYKKQLEEAHFIVINKSDLIDNDRLEALQKALSEAYPKARQFVISARENKDLEPWFEAILAIEGSDDHIPEIDYDIYADGEALLGWFNTTVQISADEPFDGNVWLEQFAAELRAKLGDIEVAHMKMTMAPLELAGDLAVLNLVRNDSAAELSHTLQDELEDAELIVNLRAEGDPDTLKIAVLSSFESLKEQTGVKFEVEHIEHFRPARPEPTHRFAEQ
ncbi:MAG: GTP-binding protein [Planctomycetota bacterium]|nr:GTP-binding protein [Planctomycetota bacterium]